MSLFGVDDRLVRLAVFGRTDTGRRRSENQDSLLIADLRADHELRLEAGRESLVPQGTVSIDVSPKGVLAAVADGMGGAAAGEVASRLAVTTLFQEMRARWGSDRLVTPQQFAFRLCEAVELANHRIHEAAQRDVRYQGMGTTLTAIGILESFAYVAQVGDSRAYLLRGDGIEQLTRDQSLVQQLLDAGALTEEAAEVNHQANVILQALGVKPTVQVDLSFQELRRGDLILLCSDGLTRTVRKLEIATTAGQTRDPACITHELVDLANSRGGPDNITVVVLSAEGDGLGAPAPLDFVGYRRYVVPL